MTYAKDERSPPPVEICIGDGKPCYVGARTADAHHRCGTVQCGRPENQALTVRVGDDLVTFRPTILTVEPPPVHFAPPMTAREIAAVVATLESAISRAGIMRTESVTIDAPTARAILSALTQK